jgi:arylsulfatase A-like enzyme
LPAGKVYEEPVISLDILPTALAAAGAKPQATDKLDGVNLLPYLTGEQGGAPHESLFWRFGKQWAVRHGDYKLVTANPDRLQTKLYNLAEDIGEAKDLSSAQPDKVAELQKLYDEWNSKNVEPKWKPTPESRRSRARRNRQREQRRLQQQQVQETRAGE